MARRADQLPQISLKRHMVVVTTLLSTRYCSAIAAGKSGALTSADGREAKLLTTVEPAKP